jgi:transcriptional regulator with XRE-family HTH domain
MEPDSPWTLQSKVLGEFIRSQRQLAKLSLRDLAARTAVSNPYLSQLERGLHEPSLRVLKVIAEALDVSTDALLAQAGLLSEEPSGPNGTGAPSTMAAIRTDPTLTEAQKTAMLAIYVSYQEANGSSQKASQASNGQPAPASTRSRQPRPSSPPRPAEHQPQRNSDRAATGRRRSKLPD